MSLIVGSNAKDFAAFREAIPAAAGRRVYYPEPNIWPSKWPLVDGSTAVLSIRPVPADLLAGKLDDSIRALCESAPVNADLNAWHEAGNLAEYAPLGFITPPAMRAVHQHMQHLVEGTPVSYGAVLCMPPNSMPQWMPGGLDWYGLDIYDFGEGQFRDARGGISKKKLFERLEDMRQTCRELTGRDAPEIDICETNDPRAGHRGEWFALLAEWLAGNGGGRLQTFWNPSGPLSGPWLPDDEETIGALRSLARTYA